MLEQGHTHHKTSTAHALGKTGINQIMSINVLNYVDFGSHLRLFGQLPATLLSDVSCLMSELLTFS